MALLGQLSALFLAGGFALGASAVSAAPAHVLVNANVRSGPGSGYAVVDTLKAGEYVVVINCVSSWCNVHHIGPDGWVARSLLVNPYYHPRPYYQFAPKYPAPGRASPGR
ncbi:MAG: SH3 domain-containing protein [Devosia sp.]